MYGIEYEDDILLLLRMIKFLHMQSPDAAHIFCQSHPVVDMEELLMVIDEVMWDIFDDVNFFFDEEYEATVVQCSHPIIDRLYEQGRASDPKHGSRQSVWSKKLHDITEYFVLGATNSVYKFSQHIAGDHVILEFCLSPDYYEPLYFANSLVDLLRYCQCSIRRIEAKLAERNGKHKKGGCLMQPAENKDYSRDVILRLSPTRNTIIVEEQKPGGIAAYREIDPLELYYVINQSYASNDYLDSGFLPEHCLHLSMSATEKYFVLWNPELRADVIYGDREYPNFPIPRMVFGVRVLENGKVAECSMGVIADEAPTMDTPMFFYPFSNVHSNDRVCTGNNVLPRYRKISALKNFPRYLLGLPDNDDMYDREHNRLKLSHGELLEHLKDKDPAYYYTDILVSNGKTLGDFISRR